MLMETSAIPDGCSPPCINHWTTSDLFRVKYLEHIENNPEMSFLIFGKLNFNGLSERGMH